jgi:triacylglycerol esterase/lipase EstA (alpha/beta hydrolase family)
MRITFPLLTGIGFHPTGQAWYFPTGNDAAAWHINAFAIQSFVDRILRSLPRHKVNPVATLHYLKGLRILRQRLEGNDDEAKVSDATISAVLKLASAAAFDGHIAISQQHMHGLRKMTDLRGGLKLFGHNTKLLVEIWRYYSIRGWPVMMSPC